MRGKVLIYDSGKPNVGITPAYAGKSSFPIVFAFSLPDHPRLCGEKVICTDGSLTRNGSPPPMRGKD